MVMSCDIIEFDKHLNLNRITLRLLKNDTRTVHSSPSPGQVPVT